MDRINHDSCKRLPISVPISEALVLAHNPTITRQIVDKPANLSELLLSLLRNVIHINILIQPKLATEYFPPLDIQIDKRPEGAKRS